VSTSELEAGKAMAARKETKAFKVKLVREIKDLQDPKVIKAFKAIKAFKVKLAQEIKEL
jgi:hypothetical protein